MASKEKDLKTAVSQRLKGRGKSIMVTDLGTVATISKLVNAPDVTSTSVDDQVASGMTQAGVDQISRSIMNRIDDNENVFKLFPDIKLASQIVVSSILSPKDMISSELIFRVKDSALPPALTNKMVQIIKGAMEKDYGLQDELSHILQKALFETGSCVKVAIPEAAVDQVINSGSKITVETMVDTELFEDRSLSKPRHFGFLGPSKREKSGQLTLESLFGKKESNYDTSFIKTEEMQEAINEHADLFHGDKMVNLMTETIHVTDNYQLLKMPKLISTVNKQKIAALTNNDLQEDSRRFQFAMESMSNKITSTELRGMLYKDPNRAYTPYAKIPGRDNLTRKSVGRPMIIELPSEAAIPVHVPGEYSRHIGYFVPTDFDGNPITLSSQVDDIGNGMSSMAQGGQAGQSLSQMLTERAAKNLADTNNVPVIDRAAGLYSKLIEADILQRLLNGSYGRKLQVGQSNDIYRIMLARSLKGQMTRLVYIPAEYVTYFAFDYHRNGVGKSYLDDLANITSMRAMLLFSGVMAKVKSSIPTTTVNVNFDERDPDPLKTLEKSKHLIVKARQQYFPHGLNRVVQLTNWIQAAGIQMTFSGHPKLPNTKFEFETSNTQHPEPSMELDEQLRHWTYMHFGLSPETVDAAAKTEFATTIEQNSVLFSRRIKILSDLFSKMLTDWVVKVSRSDQNIVDDLFAIIEEYREGVATRLTDEEKTLVQENPAGFVSYITESFFDLLEVDLPKPETTKAANLQTAFDQESTRLDNALKFIITEGVIPPEFAGKASEYVNVLTAVWKAFLMRKWMADNNYCPDAFDISTRGEGGRPTANLMEVNQAHANTVMLSVSEFLKTYSAMRVAVEADLQKSEETIGEASGTTDAPTDNSDTSNPFGDEPTGGNGEEISDPFAEPVVGEEVPAAGDGPEEPAAEKNAFEES